jgi:hypothetical protein
MRPESAKWFDPLSMDLMPTATVLLHEASRRPYVLQQLGHSFGALFGIRLNSKSWQRWEEWNRL